MNVFTCRGGANHPLRHIHTAHVHGLLWRLSCQGGVHKHALVIGIRLLPVAHKTTDWWDFHGCLWRKKKGRLQQNEALELQLKIWMRYHIEFVGNYSANHGSLKISASGIEPHYGEMAQKPKCTFHLNAPFTWRICEILPRAQDRQKNNRHGNSGSECNLT